jgi:GNAT superfamily N-acetyltransferase
MRRTYFVFDRPIAGPVSKPSGFARIRWHTPDDLPLIERHHVSADYMAPRPAAGARIAIAEINGTVAGWRFYQTGPIKQSPCFRLHLPADAIAAYAAYVLPEHRGQRIFAQIHDHCAAVLAEEGYSRIVSMTHIDNDASMKAHANGSERPIIRVDYRKMMGFSAIAVDGRWRLGRWSKARRFDIHVP